MNHTPNNTPLWQDMIPPDYLRDESRKTGFARGIAFPRTTQEVSNIVSTASQLNLPITIQGARTGISGGAVPEGGIIISLAHMKKTWPVQGDITTQKTIRVEAGFTLIELRRLLNTIENDNPSDTKRWLFTPDPTETTASLGGMAACNASGACSYAYGAMRNHVTAITVVLANGDILELRRGSQTACGRTFSLTTKGKNLLQGTLPDIPLPRKTKSAAGYYIQPDMDMLDLFIGSEGTLGIITELELLLTPKPALTAGILCYFPQESDAIAFTRSIRSITANMPAANLTAIEFFDNAALRIVLQKRTELLAGLINQQSPGCLIYLEFTSDHDLEYPVELTARLLSEHNSNTNQAMITVTPGGLEQMKMFRHAVPEMINARIAELAQQCQGITKLGTDLSVPDQHLEVMMETYRTDLALAGLEHIIFGHIGNNHLHVNIIPRSMAEYDHGKKLYQQWAKQAVKFGGSVSAEHGIGRLKKELFKLMYTPDELYAMYKLKQIFDPACLLNRNTLFNHNEFNSRVKSSSLSRSLEISR